MTLNSYMRIIQFFIMASLLCSLLACASGHKHYAPVTEITTIESVPPAEAIELCAGKQFTQLLGAMD